MGSSIPILVYIIYTHACTSFVNPAGDPSIVSSSQTNKTTYTRKNCPATEYVGVLYTTVKCYHNIALTSTDKNCLF